MSERQQAYKIAYIAATSFFLFMWCTNALTELRREIPKIEKELRKTELENARLQYEVDQFESPAHLLELARKPEFGHLKFPNLDDVMEVEEIDAD